MLEDEIQLLNKLFLDAIDELIKIKNLWKNDEICDGKMDDFELCYDDFKDFKGFEDEMKDFKVFEEKLHDFKVEDVEMSEDEGKLVIDENFDGKIDSNGDENNHQETETQQLTLKPQNDFEIFQNSLNFNEEPQEDENSNPIENFTCESTLTNLQEIFNNHPEDSPLEPFNRSFKIDFKCGTCGKLYKLKNPFLKHVEQCRNAKRFHERLKFRCEFPGCRYGVKNFDDFQAFEELFSHQNNFLGFDEKVEKNKENWQ